MSIGNGENKQGHWKITNFEIWGFLIRVCCNYRFQFLICFPFCTFYVFPRKTP